MVFSEILYYVALLFSVVLAVISTILTIKEKRKKKENCDVENREVCSYGNCENEKNSINTSTGFWSELWQKIPKYIISAEKLYNGLVGQTGKKTGAEKLAYVLDKIKLDCATNNVEYDENIATKQVNELVAFTKEVN